MFKTNMHHNQVINLGVITDGGAFVCNEFSSDDEQILLLIEL